MKGKISVQCPKCKAVTEIVIEGEIRHVYAVKTSEQGPVGMPEPLKTEPEEGK